jgi:hypothetical protein
MLQGMGLTERPRALCSATSMECPGARAGQGRGRVGAHPSGPGKLDCSAGHRCAWPAFECAELAPRRGPGVPADGQGRRERQKGDPGAHATAWRARQLAGRPAHRRSAQGVPAVRGRVRERLQAANWREHDVCSRRRSGPDAADHDVGLSDVSQSQLTRWRRWWRHGGQGLGARGLEGSRGTYHQRRQSRSARRSGSRGGHRRKVEGYACIGGLLLRQPQTHVGVFAHRHRGDRGACAPPPAVCPTRLCLDGGPGDGGRVPLGAAADNGGDLPDRLLEATWARDRQDARWRQGLPGTC